MSFKIPEVPRSKNSCVSSNTSKDSGVFSQNSKDNSVSSQTSKDSGASSQTPKDRCKKDDVLSEDQVTALFLLNQSKDVQSCKNQSRGCDVETSTRFLSLHSLVCVYPPLAGSTISGSFLVNSISTNKFLPFNKTCANVVFFIKRKGSLVKIVGVMKKKECSLFRLHLFNEENVKIFRGEIRMNIASELPDSVVREMLKNYTIKYKIVLIS